MLFYRSEKGFIRINISRQNSMNGEKTVHTIQLPALKSIVLNYQLLA